MKLGPLQKLMATLARGLTEAQLQEILRRSTEFKAVEKDKVLGSAEPRIDLLVVLRRKHSSGAAFVAKLQELLEDLEDARQLAETVRTFRELHSVIDEDTNCADYSTVERSASDIVTRAQKKAFNTALYQMAQNISKSDFEIIKGVSPVVDGAKDAITSGHALFDKLKLNGKIGPNDTELLHDMFTHMELVEPLRALSEYHRVYPIVSVPGTSPHPNPHPYPNPHRAPITTPNPHPSPTPHRAPITTPNPHPSPTPHRAPDTTPLSPWWPVQPQITAVQETGQPQTTPTNHHHPQQVRGPAVQTSTHRTGGQQPYNLSSSPSYQQQPPCSGSHSYPHRQPLRTEYHNFETQISQHPSHGDHHLPPSSHHQQQQTSTSPPSSHQSPSPPTNTHPPSRLYPSLPPPTIDPTPSAPPIEPYSSAHSFPEAISCESLGNRCSLPPQVNRAPVAAVVPHPVQVFQPESNHYHTIPPSHPEPSSSVPSSAHPPSMGGVSPAPPNSQSPSESQSTETSIGSGSARKRTRETDKENSTPSSSSSSSEEESGSLKRPKTEQNSSGFLGLVSRIFSWGSSRTSETERAGESESDSEDAQDTS